MYFISYFFMALAKVLDIVLNLFMLLIVGRAMLSWISHDSFNPVVRFIKEITEPSIHFVRSKLPITYGKIDFSPFIVFLGIVFIKTFIINSLTQLARSLI